MTVSVAGVKDQAAAARDSVVLVRANDRAAIVVTGSDRATWLNGLVTCDLAKLGPGQAAYGLLVEKKGRIQTDLFVVPSRAGDALALFVPRGLREATLAALDHYLIMEDAELTASDLVLFSAHGPKASALAGHGTFAGTLEWLGQGDVVVAAPVDAAAALEETLARAVSDAGGAVGDEAGLEAVRIERGLPRFGVEVDATLYPQEAALEKLAVSFSKGCYLGQEVVYMLEHRGHVKRKLVPLDIEGELAPERGAAVTTPAGEAVGDVKSAIVGPTSDKAVAIAMVKWAHAKPGTELRVGERSARVRAFP